MGAGSRVSCVARPGGRSRRSFGRTDGARGAGTSLPLAAGARTGSIGALGPGVVTRVVPSGSGWEGGGYVEYKLTAGPYAGRYVYAAEGVTPTVSVGQTLSAGQPVGTIVPGSSTGVEMGFAAGVGESSYASQYGGGYSEGQLTAAGQAFSDLVASLGGPAGLTEGRQPVGHFP